MGLVVTDEAGDALNAANISLWLDMRTAVLPAGRTLQALYDDLRRRELSRGRTPEDDDWALGRVPDPVGALVYSDNPRGRAEDESRSLGGALRCLVADAGGMVIDVSTGDAVGVSLDPSPSQGLQANALVDAALQGPGDIVLLGAVRPSCWADEDMPGVLRVASGACAGSGKTLAVTARTPGQVHDAAAAALAASQTALLGETRGSGGVALVLEPTPDVWESGMLYLR